MSPGAKAAFSWWPKVDLYPLVTVCAGALGVLCYSSYRTLAYNPDVRLTAPHRTDGAAEEGTYMARALKHKEGTIFRKAYHMRAAKQGEVADTRIFQ